MKEEAEEIPIHYKYRKLIQSGKVSLPYKPAALIVGPDCAYYLYSKHSGNEF